MATYQAVSAVCEAVIQILRSGYTPAAFDNTDLDFKVYVSQDFTSPMQAGVSLFLYRVMVNGAHRTPAGRVGSDGRRQLTQLPVELHILLTAWGRDASLQNAVAGWMMRTLEDSPVLSPAVLNAVWPNVFKPDESVDIVPGELSTEDLFRIWEVLTDKSYHISVPYVARLLRIESSQAVTEASPIRTRVFEAGLRKEV